MSDTLSLETPCQFCRLHQTILRERGVVGALCGQEPFGGDKIEAICMPGNPDGLSHHDYSTALNDLAIYYASRLIFSHFVAQDAFVLPFPGYSRI